MSGRRDRGAVAHRPHPSVTGGSLCGEVTRLRPCEVCEARRRAMLLVHVQSPRKPSKAFCGLLLRGEAIEPVGTPGVLPPPMYVSPERARDLAVDQGAFLPLCHGCMENLSRFDDAMRRKIGRVSEAECAADSDDDDGFDERDSSRSTPRPSTRPPIGPAPSIRSAISALDALPAVRDDGEDES